MQKRPKGWWGFDTKDIDKAVRPQDDFYQYGNGGWLKSATIPADEARWGSFVTLRYNTELELKAIIERVLKIKKTTPGSNEQMVRDMYLSADLKRRNKLGLGPLAPLRLLVRDIKNVEDMLGVVAKFHLLGISPLWGTFVDQDSKNSSRYLLHLWQGGLGLPERDYYLLDKLEQARVREAYKLHIKKLLKLAGFSTREAADAERVIMSIETKLAEVSMKKEDTRDPEKIYNKLSLAGLKKLSPAVDWTRYLARTHAKDAREIIVGQPQFFAAVSRLLRDIPVEQWKIYMEWNLINGTAGMLSEPFVKENFNFYSTALTGVKKMKPLWRRGLAATSAVVGESLGQLYIKEYFPPASKRAMDALVSDLFDVYEKRIRALDWMSAATKKKAVQKLRAMNRKIGYPSRWKGYKGLEILPDDFFGNLMRSDEFEHKRQMKKLGRPVDRTEWFMYPQTVNAYHASNLNDIVFPAGILQWPFFDPRADAAINYAGIGSVIGHEMTHGFDDQGAKFDGRGNMKNWWQSSDKRKFEKKGKLVVAQANAHEVADGVHLNGTLTLGENIADLGGLVIAWDAYQKYLAKHGYKTIGGLSPEERFFLGFAQMERELSRPEVKKMHALTDPHAAAPFRINGPLSNFEPFYKTFKLKKGDKLYRDPKTRAKIW